ncbi:MAG: twin-arginine translocase TatA/TatE family subunit [Proteobacteria bacterium]|nr:twin-arginine translocase TatA/TatE family subunit [Pseudomonadota bacterium]MCP4915358.1 twin-arginine translocase TatA/TatE family subunit [Pseudomonadota bacterium]
MIAAIPAWTLGVPELIIILVLVLILFGVGKLPAVLKSMGQGVKEFRDASTGDEAKGAEPNAETAGEETEKTL